LADYFGSATPPITKYMRKKEEVIATEEKTPESDFLAKYKKQNPTKYEAKKARGEFKGL